MLDFINNKIPDFETFIYEKLGVVEREMYDELDVNDISMIINNFMKYIKKHPNEDYEYIISLYNKTITIKYKPNDDKPNINGLTGKRNICIYKRISKNNYLDVKYTLAHEMVHLIHQLLSNNNRPFEELNTIEQLRYSLLEISSDNFENYKDSKSLSLLLYLIDRNEVLARNQNAYITAFKYKRNNPDYTNQQIISEVLDDIHMSYNYFKLAVKNLQTDNLSYNYVISFLIGNFYELGKSGYQQYFDKSIFQIPVVKTLRKEIKDIVYNEFNIDDMTYNTIRLVRKYKSELDEYKSEIINSFIKHMEYWFKEAQKRIGKAIQLGIDDAIEY